MFLAASWVGWTESLQPRTYVVFYGDTLLGELTGPKHTATVDVT